MKRVKIIDKTSLLDGGVYDIIEEFNNGYFIRCHGDCREFVFKIHTELINNPQTEER